VIGYTLARPLYHEIQAGTLKAVVLDLKAARPINQQLVAKDPIIDKEFLMETGAHAQTPTLFDFFKGLTNPVLGAGQSRQRDKILTR
jgi:hypothetical protein